MFLANFYCYNNYNTETDFIIKLDSVWKWLDYKRIEECKRCLVKHFDENKHYSFQNSFFIVKISCGLVAFYSLI